ncbi:MAG: riboflavin synthase [Bacteroidia bacterium]|nr:riboflavin synthase [Bacteroidia bacterium]
MFTGIVECMGRLISKTPNGDGFDFVIQSSLASELKIDQSLSHDGICLTVVQINEDKHTVQAIRETVAKTNIAQWEVGVEINLERCMPANGRFDGHIVQGHVDGTAEVVFVENEGGQLTIEFTHNPVAGVTVPKGSICVNGVSLTVVKSENNAFSVAIIPYTAQHTNLQKLKSGDLVNIEFDIIGKYLKKYLQG